MGREEEIRVQEEGEVRRRGVGKGRRGRVEEEGMRRGRDEEGMSGEKGEKRREGELEWRRGVERSRG